MHRPIGKIHRRLLTLSVNSSFESYVSILVKMRTILHFAYFTEVPSHLPLEPKSCTVKKTTRLL
ncbi:hypothetical protein RvY_04090, partial [Ramazzottius varieornatus]